MPHPILLNVNYTPLAEIARSRGVAFHLAARRNTAVLHLHPDDGSTLEIGDDGIGGAAAQRPSGTTGWTLTRTLPNGHVHHIYDSTLLGPRHANGTATAPLLATLDRFLPPPPPPTGHRAARKGLLRRLLRLT
ncbi:hypothetical protein OG455_27735 [Kitasatospora sp. NBC_01287]|uniref:hypothetical protein n=1 Tax=Kitasatospora sp. NBC_01287 TaxID=2903573 RepID=UPI00224FBB0B|nr:hypothetical protein [Kitasatospora sp. NBC_01287]MCX4749253.1 hypothetical protein [Kitasatospora sp. NBC_01287]